MHVLREVETKLAVGPDFAVPRLAELSGVDRVAVRTLRLKAVHYDSDDLRLARSGITLRHRTGEGRPCWTLKLATSSSTGLDREELTVRGPGTTLPSALVDLLTAQLRGAPLRVAVEIRTARTSALLFNSAGEELAEVVDDRVEVWRSGAPVDGWREVEVEQRPGAVKVARRVLKALRAAGAEDTDQTPKAVRALGTGEPDLPMPKNVRPKDPAGYVVQRALALGLAGLVCYDREVRRSVPDSVHQFRVTCRRLRSDLHVFRDLLDEPRALQLHDELTWLAGSLGAARDLEALRERLKVTAVQDPLCPLDVDPVDALLAAQEEVASLHALEVLGSTRYLILLQLLHDLACAPSFSADGQRRADEVLPPLVRSSWKDLSRRLAALGLADPDEHWHRARILAKRARYTAETTHPVLGESPRAKAAKRVQTALGLHQDAVVAAERFLELARQHPEVAVVCARLAERERAHVLSVRKAFLA